MFLIVVAYLDSISSLDPSFMRMFLGVPDMLSIETYKALWMCMIVLLLWIYASLFTLVGCLLGIIWLYLLSTYLLSNISREKQKIII